MTDAAVGATVYERGAHMTQMEPAATETAQKSKRSTRTGDIEAEVVEISDSRGRPTVQVTLSLGGVSGVGDVPAGASKGEDEAKTASVPEAIAAIEKKIIPFIQNANLDIKRYESLRELENRLIDRAGELCENLPANAVLPVSRALWQLAAAIRKLTLCGYLRKYEAELCRPDKVHFYMNIFNGGLHALKSDKGERLGHDRIDIQEIMVVPVGASNYREALRIGETIDAVLKDMLIARYGAQSVTRADEAGFSVKGLGDSGTAFGHVIEAIERSGYTPGKDVKLALDVAASSFYRKETGTYIFLGREFSTDDMIAYLCELTDVYAGKVLSIEDGLDENDWKGWARLTQEMRKRGVMTIGDDLFVTQTRRLRRGINNTSADAILIKPNQNGSMGGTLEVMRFARQNNMRCVISHRSGETLDTSIADLALATGAFGLKTGDPQPEEDFPDKSTWVRRVKYLRMIDLEESGRY